MPVVVPRQCLQRVYCQRIADNLNLTPPFVDDGSNADDCAIEAIGAMGLCKSLGRKGEGCGRCVYDLGEEFDVPGAHMAKVDLNLIAVCAEVRLLTLTREGQNWMKNSAILDGGKYRIKFR